MSVILKNNTEGFLATAVSASDTGLVLQSGNGANFPNPVSPDYFYATLVSSGGTQEVVRVTARSGDSMTVLRGQDGTTAQSFAAGSRLEMRVNAQSVIDTVYGITNYQGASSTNPVTRLDGSALQAGDFYFNTVADEVRFFNGTAWQSLTTGSIDVQNFSGNGSTTNFTLSVAPTGEDNTQVYVNGVYQQKDTYSISGTTLIFSVAPPSASTIEVVTLEAIAIGQTSSDLVTYQPAGVSAVPTTVREKLRETVSVKDFGAVGDGVTDDTAAYLNYLEEVESKLGNFSNLSDQSLYASYNQFSRKRGNVNAPAPQYAFNFPYVHLSTPATGQTTYTTADTRVVVESGDMLLRIRFKGFLNRIQVQIRSSSFLAQHTTNLCGATQPFPARASYSGGTTETTVVVRVPRTISSYNWADGVVRDFRIVLNANVAEQDSTFDIISIDYGWTNAKNQYLTQPKVDFGYKGVAIRNWNDGVSQQGAFFTDSDVNTKWFIDTIRRITQRQNDLDWVRFPIQYKYLYNNGTIFVEGIRRVLTVLDYCSAIGLNAIVTLNHGFNTATFEPSRWVQADDLATAGDRTAMAGHAATIARYIVNHPAVVAIELENEINGFLIGRQSATGLVCSNDQAYDYITKLSTAMRGVTSKPLVQSYAGGLDYTQSLWSDLSSYVDAININQYGAAREFLPDTTLPLTSFESEGNNVNGSAGFSQVVGVWSTYVDPYYTGTSYDVANLNTFNQYRPPQLGQTNGYFGGIPRYNGRLGYDANALPFITDAQNRENVYLTSIDDYYQWNDATSAWALKGW